VITPVYNNNGVKLMMGIHIAVTETDDPAFIEALTALILGYTEAHRPEQLWVIHIDNWFDHKWLRFSGTVAVPLGVPLQRYGSVKFGVWRDKLTFPPFNPNRVNSQCSYVRRDNDYLEVAVPQLPHDMKRQRSGSNLDRRIENLNGPGCFVWYSGNTAANGRGSVMLYNVKSDIAECWFAAFRREQCSWTVSASKGADRRYVESLVGAGR
jgi:hypothetical protein